MSTNKSKLTKIAESAIDEMNKRITNEIFMIIQNDRKLMHRYLRAVQDSGLDVVNKTIGKIVKNRYKLVNMSQREKKPRCTLIKSHQKFD
jgi:hypothetical protein